MRLVGFCLAAGAGSRLAPLTDRVPKPLLAPAGRPLVDLALDGLAAAGAPRAVVNAHHHAGLLAAHLAGRAGCTVLREPRLLGTGGGLANARRRGLLGAEVVLVTCADVLVDPADLARLAGALRAGAGAAVGLVPGADNPLRLRLAGGLVRPDERGRWASAGVYAVRTEALDALGPGPSELVPALLEPLWRAGRLAGAPLAGAWADAGSRVRFLDAAAGLLRGRWPYPPPPGRLDRTGPVLVVEGATVAASARMAGTAVVDRGARVGQGARIEDAVLGPGSAVGAGARVTASVLGPGATVAPGATVEEALLAG
ncbi:MAG TPA: NDP-sugar synthase [Actinomycetes bacterium]|nr:NDP-sugar synthase [Actinomycetes bacterium]